MCNAVAWTGHQVRFADQDARLPVLNRHGQIVMLRWGVHYDESSHPYPRERVRGWNPYVKAAGAGSTLGLYAFR